jgi:hypothetical protein
VYTNCKPFTCEQRQVNTEASKSRYMEIIVDEYVVEALLTGKRPRAIDLSKINFM